MARFHISSPPPRRGVVVASFVLLVGSSAATGCTSVTHARAEKPEDATRVPTVQVAEQSMPRFLMLTGSLVANRSSQVAADGSGRVRETFIERGSVVRAGDVLLQLDPRGAQLSENEARAQAQASRSARDVAQRECERAGRLFGDHAIGQAEYDRTMAQCSSAQWSSEAAAARADLASKALGDSAARAPFSGLVVERSVSVGEYVRPGTPVATLVQIDPLRLQLTVPESEISKVRSGQSVQFEVSAFPAERFTGTIALVSPAIREGTRDRVVEAIVPNAEQRLLPGMFSLARIEIERAAKPVVPRSAIRGEGTKSRIFAVVDGHLEERLVQVGVAEGEFVAIEKGARSGESIAQNAASELRDGLRVE